MASPGALSASARVHAAFNKPLQQRCSDISQILDGTSTKELHALLPMLLESIFGFNNHPGWGIDRITKTHYYEFHSVRQLLGPHGPMLRLLSQLMADPYSRYEFPLSCVPFPSMRMIEEGHIPQLYGDKLQFNQVGRPYSMINLNAFEFYFFHFAYFLVATHSQRGSSWSHPADALFPVLLEEYLNSFLPLDGRSVPTVPQQTHGGKGSMLPQSPLHRQSPASVNHGTPLSRLSNLLRSPATPASPSPYNSPYQSPTVNSPAPDHPEQETWRSRTFLQILIEFWLNQTSSPVFVEKYTVGHSYSSMRGHSSQGPYGQFNDPYQRLIFESFLPSSDHVRVVRVLVKHLHYFINSAKPDVISSPYSPTIVSPWDEFKKMVLPQLVQKQLYAFLRHGFEKWPLDSSFRLILETWLSFIQPWRYTDSSQSNKDKEQDTKEKVVEDKWSSFVVENLLFYTVLLNSYAQRCFKLELSTAKNSYMLFRVSKVFNIPNLREMIEDAEVALFHPMGRAPHGPHGGHDLGASYLSPGQRHHGNVVSILSLQFAELEGPGFQYQPLFCEETAKMIQELLSIIYHAKLTASTSSQRQSDQSSTSFMDWLGLGASFSENRGARYDGYEEFGGGSIRKAGTHLEQALNNFCNIFQLDPPEKANRSVSWGSAGQLDGKAETLTPDVQETEQGPVLTHLGRYQMINGLRKFEVEYQGDPDLQPIRSFENKAMVRILFSITSYFNYRYQMKISDLYERTDFLGRMAHQVLQPPTLRQSPNKPRPLSPSTKQKLEQHSTPRLSLRWLASYQNIGYILALYLFMFMWWGMGPVAFVFMLLLLGFFTVAFKAALQTAVKPKIS